MRTPVFFSTIPHPCGKPTPSQITLKTPDFLRFRYKSGPICPQNPEK